MEQKQYERWLLEIKQALVAGNDADASEHIKNYSSYTSEGDTNTVYLSDLTYTLEKLVYSIHKAELPLAEAELSSKSPLVSYTDNEVLYLPTSISHFDNYEDNHRLYKALTFQLLGQIQCRSADALGTLNEGIRHHGDKYLSFFSRIETLRIDQYIKKSFPGLCRDIELLHESADIDYPSNIFASANIDSVHTSLHLTAALLESTVNLPELVYQSSFQLDLMANVQKLTGERKAPLILNPTTDVDEETLDTRGDPRKADRG